MPIGAMSSTSAAQLFSSHPNELSVFSGTEASAGITIAQCLASEKGTPACCSAPFSERSAGWAPSVEHQQQQQQVASVLCFFIFLLLRASRTLPVGRSSVVLPAPKKRPFLGVPRRPPSACSVAWILSSAAGRLAGSALFPLTGAGLVPLLHCRWRGSAPLGSLLQLPLQLQLQATSFCSRMVTLVRDSWRAILSPPTNLFRSFSRSLCPAPVGPELGCQY